MNPENRVEFTKDMMDYTLLAPNMADVHFSILTNILAQGLIINGVKEALIKSTRKQILNTFR